jgi:O-antigen/teichoic acid export membrane protein
LEYTLQIRPGSDVDYQLYFTAGAVVQGLLFLSTNAAAEILKLSSTYAPVAPLVHVMSLLFLLDLGHEFRIKMLERAMDWQRLRTLEGIGILASALLSLFMALAGAGVYALLVPSLVLMLPAGVDLFFIQGWRPKWKWDADAFRTARRYGFTRLSSGLFGWGRVLMESTILVKIVGFSTYGIYGRALGLATICCLKVPSVLSQSLFPVLTKLDPGSGRSSRASTLLICSVAWTTFPAAVIVSVLASPVIRTLYGTRWSGAIPFIPWALAAGAVTALTQTSNMVLLANLQQKRSMWIEAVTLAGTAVGLMVLAPRSLKLYLMGTVVAQGGAFLLIMAWLYRSRSIDLSGIANSVILPAISVTATFLGMESLRALLGFSTESVGGAILYGAAFSAIYLLLIRLTSRQQCREIVSFLPGRSYLERWLVLGT